jgi:hypothetical protein
MLLRTVMAEAGQAAPDFWVSLGYDFVNMAASLPISQDASAETVNFALNALSDLPWSGAPIIWDNHGKASQELFVLTPAEQGFTLADPAKFRVYFQRAWATAPFQKPDVSPGPAGEAVQ